MNSRSPEDFCDVFDQLQRGNVPYVVVGGVAVVLRGTARQVADLDIVVSSDPQDASRAMEALLLAGFVPSIPLPLSLLTVLRLFDSSGREVDVFINFAIPFNELFAASTEMPVGENFARVASMEHLIRAKEWSARPDDLQDVNRLVTHEDLEPS